MRNVGVEFEIPNESGNYLSDILQPLPINLYQWLVDNDDIHVFSGNEISSLFNDDDRIFSGERLYERLKNATYLMVFITLRAFPKDGIIQKISLYEDFLASDCQIVLTVFDCAYVMLWCKDSQLVLEMYKHAALKNYKNVKIISEDEIITHKYSLQ